MGVSAYTSDSDALLARLKKRIEDGDITSWTVDDDDDFCHKADQVADICCFRTETLDDKLYFKTRWYKRAKLTAEERGTITAESRAELHGHAVRMLIVHGGSTVTSIRVYLPLPKAK